jgi:hypothetical protein
MAITVIPVGRFFISNSLMPSEGVDIHIHFYVYISQDIHKIRIVKDSKKSSQLCRSISAQGHTISALMLTFVHLIIIEIQKIQESKLLGEVQRLFFSKVAELFYIYLRSDKIWLFFTKKRNKKGGAL